MCKSHKILHLCGCFLRHPSIEYCAAALARLNCTVEDVIDLSWRFCPDYPNCEVVISGDTAHYREQARLPLTVPAAPGSGGGRRNVGESAGRVRFRDGSTAASGGSGGAGYGGGGVASERDTAAGLENGVDRQMAREEESEE